MDYRKLHWESDFTSAEVYGEGVEEFAIGLYTLVDFPQIAVYINVELDEIVEVFLITD